MVARHQHISHQPVAIALDSPTQRLQVGIRGFFGCGEIAVPGEPADLRRGIGNRGGGGVGGTEQRLLAGVEHGIAGEVIDAGELRQRRADRGG